MHMFSGKLVNVHVLPHRYRHVDETGECPLFPRPQESHES